MEAECPTSNHENREPVMIVLERAGDGTWIATPEYGDDEEDGHYYAPPSSPCANDVPFPLDDDDEEELVDDSVTEGWSRAHCIRVAKWALACSITDFKNDIKEFIEDHFLSGGVEDDRPAQVERVNALYNDDGHGDVDDERAHLMLLLLRDALKPRDYDEPPAPVAVAVAHQDVGLDHRDDEEQPPAAHHHQDAEAAALLREKDGDDESGSHDGDVDVVFKEKAVSAAGFVDRLHMRKCIKAFFDPDIHVHDESSDDTAVARHLWANFMSATGFVDRLWDVRRIVDVFFEHGLDEETRRATVVRMLRDVERLLKDRATAVATGKFNLF